MYNVIINPTAGKNKAVKISKKVSRYLKRQNVEFLVYFSESVENLIEITQKLCKDGEKDFIVIGGDGTLNHFVNSLTDPSKISFGIIPAGRHNHFARYLNIPKNPILAIKNILEHPALKIDYLKCNEYRALNLISCGLLESVEQKFLEQTDNKKLSRKAILKNTLTSFEGLKLNIEADDLHQKDKLYTACAICNGGFYGNNIYISPLSNMHDGLANIITIEFSNNKTIKQDYAYAKKGKHIYKNLSSNVWSSHINIKSENNFDAIIDGEMYKFNEMEINVISKGLNIYCKRY